MIVQTTPQVSTQDVEAIILAEMFDPATGRRVNATTTVVGDLAPYSRATARMMTFPQVAGQFEVVQFEVRVINDAVFPDVFSVEAFADKDDFILLAPPNVYVPPLSSRSFNVTVRTPYGVPYEFGESTTIAVRMTSVYSGQTFPVVGILRVEGFYVSTAWWPLLALALVSAAVLGRSARERAQLRRLERGRPRRVEPTPRQAVLLADLKTRDREAWKAQQARLDAVYAERRRAYKEERKRIRAADREEAKRARAEYQAAKRRQKEERARAKAQAKIDRREAKRRRKIEKKAAKAQAKIDRKQAKVDAKERKKLEKQLAKKRKLLEKARAKAAKAEAKEARAAAKAEKKAAKQAGRRKT